MRVWVNRSPVFSETMSQDRVGLMPCRRAAAKAGRPMPMLSSVSTEIDSLAPWSASRRHSSSVRVLQCTWIMVRSEQARRGEFAHAARQ